MEKGICIFVEKFNYAQMSTFVAGCCCIFALSSKTKEKSQTCPLLKLVQLSLLCTNDLSFAYTQLASLKAVNNRSNQFIQDKFVHGSFPFINVTQRRLVSQLEDTKTGANSIKQISP